MTRKKQTATDETPEVKEEQTEANAKRSTHERGIVIIDN